MQPTDLARELTKAHVALGHAAAYLQRCDQAEAVRRLVMPEALTYSPLTTEVVTAHGSLGQVIERLQEQTETTRVGGVRDAPPLRPDPDLVGNSEGNQRILRKDRAAAQAIVDAQTVRADAGMDEPKPDQRCKLCGAVNPEAELCPADESGPHVLEPARAGDG